MYLLGTLGLGPFIRIHMSVTRCALTGLCLAAGSITGRLVFESGAD
jgi:hypothetical protein